MKNKKLQPTVNKKKPPPRNKPKLAIVKPEPRAKPTKANRERPLTLITQGNTKLGPKLIWGFNIPALSTCPGHSEVCSSVCYALSGHYTFTSVRDKYDQNLRRTKEDSFVDDMVDEITRARAQVFRPHSSGDMYSVTYIQKWINIATRCPDTRFFIYTRSWRIPRMLTRLCVLANLPNVQLWFSIDSSTGIPTTKPRNVRYAYLLMNDSEEALIPPEADLIFRNEVGRIAKKLGGVQVCTYENGIPIKTGKITCDRCSICWMPPRSRS